MADEHWQALHRRAVMGEALSRADRAAYEAGCRQLDDGERLDGSLAQLRELRANIAAAETEQEHLRAREAELDARMADLELRLEGSGR